MDRTLPTHLYGDITTLLWLHVVEWGLSSGQKCQSKKEKSTSLKYIVSWIWWTLFAFTVFKEHASVLSTHQILIGYKVKVFVIVV